MRAQGHFSLARGLEPPTLQRLDMHVTAPASSRLRSRSISTHSSHLTSPPHPLALSTRRHARRSEASFVDADRGNRLFTPDTCNLQVTYVYLCPSPLADGGVGFKSRCDRVVTLRPLSRLANKKGACVYRAAPVSSSPSPSSSKTIHYTENKMRSKGTVSLHL